jgi:rhodanese-related sulfurtransferase
MVPRQRPRLGTGPPLATGKDCDVASVITRDELRRFLADGAVQLVDVLTRAEYDEEHIPGAVNLPLHELDATTAHQLDAARPVVTYCHDSL